MPLRRTVRKLSSNLSIDTPIFVAIAGLHRTVEANSAIARRFMFPSSLAAPGRAFSLPAALFTGGGHAFSGERGVARTAGGRGSNGEIFGNGSAAGPAERAPKTGARESRP